LAQGEGGGHESNPDPEGAPAPLEEGQLEGDAGLTAVGWTPNAILAREYIWGPGDSYAGVDELLVQFDHERKPWWVSQDGGGDVVAVVETPGTSPSSTQPARVCGQWTYDAYGAVTSSDLLHEHAAVHCGHNPRQQTVDRSEDWEVNLKVEARLLLVKQADEHGDPGGGGGDDVGSSGENKTERNGSDIEEVGLHGEAVASGSSLIHAQDQQR